MVGGVKAHNFLFSGFPFAGPSLYGKISLSYLLLWGVGVLYLGKRPLSVVCVFVVCVCVGFDGVYLAWGWFWWALFLSVVSSVFFFVPQFLGLGRRGGVVFAKI